MLRKTSSLVVVLWDYGISGLLDVVLMMQKNEACARVTNNCHHAISCCVVIIAFCLAIKGYLAFEVPVSENTIVLVYGTEVVICDQKNLKNMI